MNSGVHSTRVIYPKMELSTLAHVSPTIGFMAKSVEILTYDPLWVERFREESAQVANALGENCVTIHHIGSTSVPGLAAKPVVDMAAVIRDFALLNLPALQELGFVARGENGLPFRRFFVRDQPRVHLHAWEEGNPEITLHLMFRDHLRSHPEDARAYESLKKRLAQQFPDDMIAYSKAKDRLIHEIILKSGFDGILFRDVFLDREWEAYHRLRKTLLFDPVGIVYDPDHPSMSAPDFKHFTLSKGGVIVGAAAVQFLGEGNEVALRSFAVDHEYQGQGLGRKMLELVERWVKMQGRSVIKMHANKEAEGFYRKLGYEDCSFADASIHSNVVDLGKTI